MTHTELRLSTGFDGKRTIVDDCGYVGEAHESHAEFIVKACNSHAKLVEALEMILLFHHIETAKDYAKSALQQLKETP